MPFNKPQPPAPPTSGKFEMMGAPGRWSIRNGLLIVERASVSREGEADTYATIFAIPVDGILAAVREARQD